MSILTISATKPAPDSTLGIKYVVNNSAMIVNHISDSSIFAAGDLQVGHTIVSINGTAVSGLSKDKVKMIISSLGKEVIFEVKNSWSATFLEERNYSRTMPSFLEIAGVPLSKWKHIYDLLETELKPVVAKSLKMNEIYNREMEVYTSKQMGKGHIGFGQESHHEKKVLQMVQQVSSLTNNTTLVATNVLVKANAVLSKHEIICAVAVETLDLPKYSTKQRNLNQSMIPCGIEFILAS